MKLNKIKGTKIPSCHFDTSIFHELSKLACEMMKNELFPVTPDDLRGKSQKMHIVSIRRACMWIAYWELKATYKVIGMYYGGKKHETALMACKEHEKFYSSNLWYQKKFDGLLTEVKKLK